MKFPRYFRLAIVAGLGLLPSCESLPLAGLRPPGAVEPPPLVPPPAPPVETGPVEQPASWMNISYWDDDGSPGTPWIQVDLDRQIAEFFRGANRVGVAAISSGTEGRTTPAGEYRILEKTEDKYSTSYGHIEDAFGKTVNADATPRTPVPPGCRYVPAPMPFWMRLTKGGIGMHQGFLPGYAASHGCIRMDRNVVQKFYGAAKVGMRVKVIKR